MALNWIDLQDFPFESFVLFERFQIRYLCAQAAENAQYRQRLSIALAAHPAVAYAFARRCPEHAALIDAIVREAPAGLPPEGVREAELALMGASEDFVLYCYPELMDSHCDFIYAWDKARLFELVALEGKTVLDVGSGSGRLAFAAAERASFVYASEPVATLREYLRDKIRREGITNMAVVDGMANWLPYPDDTFDIAMSGHVVGDDYDGEIAELTRVVKSGGWLIDCPGEEARKRGPDETLLARGWEQFHYISALGGDVYRYRKQVIK